MAVTDDPCEWSATAAAAAISAKAISSREYLEALLARISSLNPGLGLVATLDERAFAAAAQADELTMRGESLGPLHGVALSLKDSFATAGLRTTCGSPDLATFVPTEDAAVVRSLKNAGAYVFAKTNMPAYAADVQTYGDLLGTARNPWNEEFTTGGSSGGSAGAVAAGFSAVEIGTDVAGSIRIPAAYCGVIGHKPTFGIVPLAGSVPPYPRKYALPDLAVAGPFGRFVEDVELLLDIVAGPHPWDAPAWRFASPPARPGRRLALWFDDPYCPVDDEIVRAMMATADLLQLSGWEVQHDQPPIDFEECDLAYLRLLAWVNGGDYTPQEIEEIAAGRERAGAELAGRFVAQRFREWKSANELRHRMREVWRRFFQRYDAVLLPVTPSRVGPHDHRDFGLRTIVVNGVHRPYWDQIRWAGLTGMVYLPSTVIPIARDTRGMPIGMTICGPYLEDRTTLRIAQEILAVIPPIGRPLGAVQRQ